jgi:hypothetical protein
LQNHARDKVKQEETKPSGKDDKDDEFTFGQKLQKLDENYLKQQ